ncbi:LysR family transcriptional regulator [Asticcacaulis sp. DXS10W]|uniref:LysR family transcriptional regulator n=1 Tax=Asticcacaulis currens TaxID=2984210 RepID=A0ABT5IE44_9CAUL|nr:LysR family transcriptional regulator [Asticcacaulis currens]MDC7694213.1 LysR family transcriptional regulator [Asticcacaulis currens]
MTDLSGRSGELEVFAAIVAAGGVSAGARRLGLVPSTASRMLKRLEERIGARLIVRESRLFRLTREGETCYRSARRILADLDELEQTLGDGVHPRGLLKVSTSIAFGRLHILPLIDAFNALYPDVTVQVSLTDRVVDLTTGEADVAIRIGRLPDSDLKVRKLAESARLIVGSPAYLAQYGTPLSPDALEQHVCLRLATSGRTFPWPFVVSGSPVEWLPNGPFIVDNGEALVQLAIAGFGLARVGAFHISGEIARGELIPVLELYRSTETEIIQAVFAGQPAVSGRVRAFVDFLADTLVV